MEKRKKEKDKDSKKQNQTKNRPLSGPLSGGPLSASLPSYLRPHALKMAGGVSIKFSGTIMDLLIPWILAYLIDTIVPRESIPQIVLWSSFMILCSILALMLNIKANHIAARVSADTTTKIRRDLFKKIMYLSCGNIDEITIPSVISRLTSDTYNIHQMIGMIQRMGVRAPILLLGGIAVTLTLDFGLALVLIAMLPPVTIVVYLISRKGIPLYRKLQQKVDVLVRKVRETITGIRVIKALSKADYERDRFEEINENVVEGEKKAAITMAATNPIMNFLLNLGLILVIIVGAHRVNSDLTQPGKIVAFLSYFTIILNAMLAITRIFVIISRGSASFRRVTDVLNTTDDLDIKEPDIVETPYHISFENVSFSYQKIREDLKNINFSLNRGETLGIIGHTGSGKSSIVKLLMRFYDSDEGTIRINGQDVKSIPFNELHEKFGIVFQNDILFADTIAANISFGRDLNEKEILKSTTFAQADEFISDLDEKLDYKLSIKGANLSGGQKQRVLISRALAGNPEILVLDDSSSALDYKTDASLRHAINKNYKETTTIIVAQRINSVANADKIIVLEDGEISGIGTHAELLKICPSYAQINDLQKEGAISG